jgi:pre-mRNA cleavage complex 2 protein Pcf11
VKGKSHTDEHQPLNAKAATAAEITKRDAELQALYVAVPSGDEAKPVSCPICKKTIKSEFLEDNEDWVWKNVMKKDDRVCLQSSFILLSLIDLNGRYTMQRAMRKLWL